ncbi:MAG: BON domain-containing protein [Bryobacteraceae bacterium]|nr:BON domain-containing protein [Bryobacteraceae bacterium]
MNRAMRAFLFTGAAAAAWLYLRNLRSRRAERIVALVRSRLAHLLSYPRAVEVLADGSHVTLRGVVPRHEFDEAIRAVESVEGVERVHAELIADEGGQPSQRPAWSGSPARLLAYLGGGGLTAYSLAKRDLLSLPAGIAGLGLLARASTRAAPAPYQLHKTIVIDRPLTEVFALCRVAANLPRALRAEESLEPHPPSFIRCRAGTVSLEALPAGRTRVAVRTAAANVRSEVEEDLRALKRKLESTRAP